MASSCGGGRTLQRHISWKSVTGMALRRELTAVAGTGCSCCLLALTRCSYGNALDGRVDGINRCPDGWGE
jgi:broad specificity polyphosphatase/5'/3'-nucleotidase SurE